MIFYNVLALGPAGELFHAVIPGVSYCVIFRARDPHSYCVPGRESATATGRSCGQTKNPDPAEAEPGFLDLLSI